MSEDRSEELVVPPFVQIITAASHAFGRAADEYAMTDVLYGLDQKGRVWQWMIGDPDWKGSEDGWELLPNTVYKEGEEPPPKPRTR
jgi:hypothetical protein